MHSGPPCRCLATTPPPPGGFLIKGARSQRFLTVVVVGALQSTSRHRNSWRSIFDSEMPIVNAEKRYSDCVSRLRNRRISTGRHCVGRLVGGLPRSKHSEVPFYRGGICDSATSAWSFRAEELLTLTYTGR